MRDYLSRVWSSVNRNKINGILAEIDFRALVAGLGYASRVSPGGWVARTKGPGIFARGTCVFFPQVVQPGVPYDPARTPDPPPGGLHAVAATFHQSGIHAYYCAPDIERLDGGVDLRWRAVQLGLPTIGAFEPFPDLIVGFEPRAKRYNYLRYSQDTSSVPDERIPEEFSKEHARISFESKLRAEVSDVDAILYGQQFAYPVEIKEKTAAYDRDVGDYFGLDVGPFTKLAFYAAKRGNVHSLFVVREIEDVETRALTQWWAITFEQLAPVASWVFRAGGTNMRGGASSVVRIPKQEFIALDAAFLASL